MPYDGDQRVEPAPAWADDLDALRGMAALLATELRCSPTDLDANRAGLLAPRQRRRLIRRLARHVAELVLSGAVVLVLLVIPLVSALINVVTGAPRTGDSLFVLFFFGPTIVLLLMGMAAGLPQSQARDLLDVLRAAAPVQRVVGEVRDGDGGREVRLGPLTYSLTARVDAGLLAPGRYAAYHVGSPFDSPILLSAELLAAETPD